MIEYRSVILARKFSMPLVKIEFNRWPLDVAYGAFVLAEVQTEAYEECFSTIIVGLDTQGTNIYRQQICI